MSEGGMGEGGRKQGGKEGDREGGRPSMRREEGQY